jgi:Sel1 repeat
LPHAQQPALALTLRVERRAGEQPAVLGDPSGSIPELGWNRPGSDRRSFGTPPNSACFVPRQLGTRRALGVDMEHIDSLGLSFSLAFAASPHRRAWFSALAVGVLGCFAVAWGSPSQALSAPGTSADVLAFAKNCDNGDAVSCNDLGVSSVHGAGVPADATAAVRAFERSCRGGSPDGCSNLGALYERGVGVEGNLLEAARLYEQACSTGGALGCSNLGALYARGRGVARDAGEAQRLFQLSCETGSAAGCNNLIATSAR